MKVYLKKNEQGNEWMPLFTDSKYNIGFRDMFLKWSLKGRNE